MAANKVIGDEAELVAERWLQAQGLKPLERQYRCRFGEIDLIMKDGATLVLVEVKYRSHKLADAIASVGFAKQKKLSQAARLLFTERPQWQSLDWRFDVLAMAGNPQTPQINWFKAAFELTG